MKTIYILLILFFIGCKTEPKKKVVKEVIEIENINNKTDTDTVVKMNKEDSSEVKSPRKKKVQIQLNYSLKTENVKTLKDSAAYLKHYYTQFEQTKDSLSEILFFEMLPNNFSNFKNLYGYNDLPNGDFVKGLLYEAEKQIEHKFKYIDLERKINKFIDISINGYWQADNINFFQNKLHQSYKVNKKMYNTFLENKSESEIEGFWKFFFDGPHPENQQEVYSNVLANIDEAMVPIVKSAYAKVKEDWAEH